MGRKKTPAYTARAIKIYRERKQKTHCRKTINIPKPFYFILEKYCAVNNLALGDGIYKMVTTLAGRKKVANIFLTAKERRELAKKA